jgi:hypothetical protein
MLLKKNAEYADRLKKAADKRYGGRVSKFDGRDSANPSPTRDAASTLLGVKVREGKQLPIRTFRCIDCGFLESYAK